MGAFFEISYGDCCISARDFRTLTDFWHFAGEELSPAHIVIMGQSELKGKMLGNFKFLYSLQPYSTHQ